MPLYEYRCDDCEHQFEVIQSFSDKPLRKCEKCGGKVRKLISRAGFVLKGGGWYKDAYGSSSSKKDSSSSDSSDAKPSGETKPEGSSSESAAEKSPKAETGAATRKKKAKG